MTTFNYMALKTALIQGRALMVPISGAPYLEKRCVRNLQG